LLCCPLSLSLGSASSSRLISLQKNARPGAKGKPQKVTKKVRKLGYYTSLDSHILQYIINASQPANDKIFDVSAFEKFLHDKIKVDGRVGNLGDTVQISQAGDGNIEVVTHIPFSGRYLKYL
jgi:large subunit ribosomal protein L22e